MCRKCKNTYFFYQKWSKNVHIYFSCSKVLNKIKIIIIIIIIKNKNKTKQNKKQKNKKTNIKKPGPIFHQI